ncbi:MAG: hypothetical protein MI806_31580 [Minwuiales bacterium]|nr:hypothetical protein [Minwuiales bacterium]
MIVKPLTVVLLGLFLAACASSNNRSFYNPQNFIPNPPSATERYTTDRNLRERSTGELYQGESDF